MALLGFQTLHCPKCSLSKVVQVGEVIWQEGKGQSWRPLGYYCYVCAVPFDTENAIKALKEKELEEKIKELKQSRG